MKFWRSITATLRMLADEIEGNYESADRCSLGVCVWRCRQPANWRNSVGSRRSRCLYAETKPPDDFPRITSRSRRRRTSSPFDIAGAVSVTPPTLPWTTQLASRRHACTGQGLKGHLWSRGCGIVYGDAVKNISDFRVGPVIQITGCGSQPSHRAEVTARIGVTGTRERSFTDGVVTARNQNVSRRRINRGLRHLFVNLLLNRGRLYSSAAFAIATFRE